MDESTPFTSLLEAMLRTHLYLRLFPPLPEIWHSPEHRKGLLSSSPGHNNLFVPWAQRHILWHSKQPNSKGASRRKEGLVFQLSLKKTSMIKKEGKTEQLSAYRRALRRWVLGQITLRPSFAAFWLQEEGHVVSIVMSNWALHSWQFQEQLSTMVLKLKGYPLRLSLNINTLKHFLLNVSNF